MTTNDAERVLELEDAAEGVEEPGATRRVEKTAESSTMFVEWEEWVRLRYTTTKGPLMYIGLGGLILIILLLLFVF